MALIYNGILLGHIKESNVVICRDMNGLRDYRVKKKKQIPYINAYMLNLK